MRLMLARITYGSIEPLPSRHLNVATWYAQRHGVEWVGDGSPDRQPHAAARNGVVKMALSPEWPTDEVPEGVMWVDDDVILPKEAIARLAHYCSPGGGDMDFVAGVYFQRHPPHWPLFAEFDGEAFHWGAKWADDPVIAPTDGVGFGCVLTTTRLLRRMLESKWGRKEWKDELFEYGAYSEDLTFCVRARRLGVRPHVDTGILCGHYGEREVVTVDTFRRCRERLRDDAIREARGKWDARLAQAQDGP